MTERKMDELERHKFIRAFVAGHDWLRFKETWFTSFPSERDEAEDEANKRFDAMLEAAPSEQKAAPGLAPAAAPGVTLSEEQIEDWLSGKFSMSSQALADQALAAIRLKARVAELETDLKWEEDEAAHFQKLYEAVERELAKAQVIISAHLADVKMFKDKTLELHAQLRAAQEELAAIKALSGLAKNTP